MAAEGLMILRTQNVSAPHLAADCPWTVEEVGAADTLLMMSRSDVAPIPASTAEHPKTGTLHRHMGLLQSSALDNVECGSSDHLKPDIIATSWERGNIVDMPLSGVDRPRREGELSPSGSYTRQNILHSPPLETDHLANYCGQIRSEAFNALEGGRTRDGHHMLDRYDRDSDRTNPGRSQTASAIVSHSVKPSNGPGHLFSNFVDDDPRLLHAENSYEAAGPASVDTGMNVLYNGGSDVSPVALTSTYMPDSRTPPGDGSAELSPGVTANRRSIAGDQSARLSRTVPEQKVTDGIESHTGVVPTEAIEQVKITTAGPHVTAIDIQHDPGPLPNGNGFRIQTAGNWNVPFEFQGLPNFTHNMTPRVGPSSFPKVMLGPQLGFPLSFLSETHQNALSEGTPHQQASSMLMQDSSKQGAHTIAAGSHIPRQRSNTYRYTAHPQNAPRSSNVDAPMGARIGSNSLGTAGASAANPINAGGHVPAANAAGPLARASYMLSQTSPRLPGTELRNVRVISGLDISRQIAFSRYSPQEQQKAIAAVGAAYPTLSVPEVKKTLSRAITKYAQEQRPRG